MGYCKMIKDFYKTLDFNDFKYSQEFFDLKISKKNYYLTFAISVFIFSFFFSSSFLFSNSYLRRLVLK